MISWGEYRIKDIKSSVANAFSDGPFGSNLKTQHFITNGNVYVIDSGYITSGSFNIHREFRKISEEHFETVNRSECIKDDLIIAKIGANYGMSAILPLLDKKSLVSGNTLKLTINHKKFDVFYIHYLFLQLKESGQIDVLVKGSAQPALSMGLLNDLLFKIPRTKKEQTTIATYLDRKTKAIDQKINLLIQKTAKYKELRKAIINQTVTKGLDKNVQLKDSGIEWIGEIPLHWEVRRFKHFGYTIKGKSMRMEDFKFKGSLPLLSLEYLRNDNVEHPVFCYSNDKSLLSTEDDIIIVWDGAAVGEILKSKKGYISSTIAKIALDNRIYSTKYFYHIKESIDYTLKQIPTGMGIPHLNPTLFKNFKCPFPPLSEQTAIANYLDKKTGKIDAIVNNIEKQINTLKELRKTLINEVVTGKIKVSC